MRRMYTTCCLVLVLGFSGPLFAQKDLHSTHPRKERAHDSLRLYKRIKHIAYKHKITRWAYDAVFVDPEPLDYPAPAAEAPMMVNPYLDFDGAIISRLDIEVYDPFGYSVNDTVQHPVNGLQRWGNTVHLKTHRRVIRNRLLIRQGEALDALAVTESERILRSMLYVNDARIYVTELGEDSVYVRVVVHDKWPVTVPIFISDVSGNIRFKNNNVFGSGDQFEQYAGYSRSSELATFSGLYNISNIDRSYISSQLAYETYSGYTRVGLSFDRPFYSPLAKWAGGASAEKLWSTYSYKDSISGEDLTLPLDRISDDFWIGKSFKLSRDTTLFTQSTNLILGARYYETHYQRRPSADLDKNRAFADNQAYIGNIGFAVQQYYKDKYIYRFGANEDVPEGLIVQWLYGAYKREGAKIRYYTGFEVARARHFHFGYLSATVSYGVFFNRHVTNDITMNGRLYYFSDLHKKGRWYFRQFANYYIVHGEHKLNNETITLNSEELYGFSKGNIAGTSKMVLNLETVAYAPYKLIGFQFAPLAMIGLGMLGDPQHQIMTSRLYQGYALGLLVRNENLLSSTFEVSFGLYPFLPEGGNYVVKYNPVTSFTLRVRGFSVGKPAFVSYY